MHHLHRYSPDWNDAPEPTVGDHWNISADGMATFRRQAADPYIYHHKWLFVADDSPGFDVAESRERSRTWAELEGVDRSRIGRRSYWERKVTPQLEKR